MSIEGYSVFEGLYFFDDESTWISSIKDILKSGQEAAESTAFNFLKRFAITEKKNDDREFLREKTGNDHFANFLSSYASPFLVDLIERKTKELYDKDHQSLQSDLKKDREKFERLISYFLVRIGRNLADDYLRENEVKEVGFSEILLYTLQFLEDDLKEIDQNYPKVQSITNEKERNEAYYALLRPIADKVINKAFPKKLEEVPLRYFQQYLWNMIRDEAIPSWIDTIYLEIFNPLGKDKGESLEKRVGGGFLSKVSGRIAEATVLDKAPFLIFEARELIASGMVEKQMQPWLADEIGKLAESDHPMMKKTWGFFFRYLKIAVVNLFEGLTSTEDNKNAILTGSFKLIDLVGKFIEKNKDELDLLKPTQTEAVENLFRPLIDDLMKLTDTHKGHLLKEYPAIKEHYLPHFLFEYYQDIIKPQVKLDGRFSEQCPELAKQVKELTQDYLKNDHEHAANLLCSVLSDKLDDKDKNELAAAIKDLAASEELKEGWDYFEKMIGSALFKILNRLADDNDGYHKPGLSVEASAEAAITRGLLYTLSDFSGSDISQEALRPIARELLENTLQTEKEIPVPSVQFQGIIWTALEESILPDYLAKLYEKREKSFLALKKIVNDKQNLFEESPLNQKEGGKALLFFMRSLAKMATGLTADKLKEKANNFEKGNYCQQWLGKMLLSSTENGGINEAYSHLLESVFIFGAENLSSRSGDENAFSFGLKEVLGIIETQLSNRGGTILSLDKKVQEAKASIEDETDEEKKTCLLKAVEVDERKLITEFRPIAERFIYQSGLHEVLDALDPEIGHEILPALLLDYYRDIHAPKLKEVEAKKDLKELINDESAPMKNPQKLSIKEAKKQLSDYEDQLEQKVSEAQAATTLFAKDARQKIRGWLLSKPDEAASLLCALFPDLTGAFDDVSKGVEALSGSDDPSVQKAFDYLQEAIEGGAMKLLTHVMKQQKESSASHPNEEVVAKSILHMSSILQKNHSSLDPDIGAWEYQKNKLAGAELLQIEGELCALEKIQKRGKVPLNKILAEIGNEKISLKERFFLEEVVKKQFYPLGLEFLKLATDNLSDEVPLPKALRPHVVNFVQNEWLPSLFATLYKEGYSWLDQKEGMKKDLNQLFHTNHMNELARVLSRFGRDYIPFYLSSEKKKVVTKLNENVLGTYLDAFSNKKGVDQVLLKNIDVLATSESEEIKGVLDISENLMEAMLLKFFQGFAKTVDGREKKVKGTSQFIGELLLDILNVSKDHLKAVNGVTIEAKKGVAHKVDPKKMREGFKKRGLLHSSTEEAWKISDRIDSHVKEHGFINQNDLPAYLVADTEFKNCFVITEITHGNDSWFRWELKNSIGMREKERKAFFEEVREKVVFEEFYKPLADKLLQASNFERGEKDPIPLYKMFKETLLPTLLKSMYGILTDPHTLNSLFLSSLENLNAIESGAKEEQRNENFREFRESLVEIRNHVARVGTDQIQDLNNLEHCRHLLDIAKGKFLKNDLNSPEVFSSIHKLDKTLQKLEQVVEPQPGEENSEVKGVRDEVESKISDTMDVIKSFIEEKAIDSEEQKAFNEACGELVMELIEMIPHTFTQPILKVDNLRNYTKEVIGIAFRKKMENEQWTFLKLIDRAVKSGLPLVHDGEFEGEAYSSKFQPSKGELKFNFAKTPTQKALEKKKYDKRFKETQKKLENEMAKMVREQITDTVRRFFSKYWKDIQEFLDKHIQKLFGEKGMKAKRFLDVQCRRVFIQGIGTLLSFLFSVFAIPAWCLINLQVKKRARDFMKNFAINEQEDLIRRLTDVLMNKLKTPREMISGEAISGEVIGQVQAPVATAVPARSDSNAAP